jgi:predicted glycosyl hydrolase (DUF1957 family)
LINLNSKTVRKYLKEEYKKHMEKKEKILELNREKYELEEELDKKKDSFATTNREIPPIETISRQSRAIF